MNKFLLQIAFLVLPFIMLGQKSTAPKVEKKWKEIRESHGFKKSKDYKGPEGYGEIYPSTIKENEATSTQQGSTSTSTYQGAPYSSNQIRQGRQVPSSPGGNGTQKPDPKITKPDPIYVPDINGPQIDAPDIDGPDISGEFWKYLLIILLLVLVAVMIYFILKNRTPSNVSLPFEALEENLNPATIPKTELEIRLEEAEEREDYKECVRIYFLFAMKELIEKRWIFWKKDKTNIHYIIEMQGKPTSHDFEKIVGIYELVWYGDYHIDKQAYLSVEPVLADYYRNLETLK